MKHLIHLAASSSIICLPGCEDERNAFGDASGEAVLARYAAYGADTVVLEDGSGDIVVKAGEGVCRYRTDHIDNRCLKAI